jgi:hypothetical protein
MKIKELKKYVGKGTMRIHYFNRDFQHRVVFGRMTGVSENEVTIEESNNNIISINARKVKAVFEVET